MTGGLVLGEALDLLIPAEQIFFGLAVCLLFFVCVFLRERKGGGLPVFSFMEKGKKRFALVLLLTGFLIGSFRMETEQELFRREESFFLEEHADGVVIAGTIQSRKAKDGTLEVLLKDCVLKAETGEKEQKFRRVLCYLDQEEETDEAPAMGKRIRIFGDGKAADPARNPGVFDYRLYCRAKGISGIVYAEGYAVTGGTVNRLSELLYHIRRALSERLKRIALPEDSGILMAVLFGEKEELDTEIYELYRKNGISHLLAISGLHVSIVGLGMWKMFRKGGAGFWISGLFAGGFLYFYGRMVGFGPSVVRAVTMAGLSFLAAAVGRTYDLPTAMCIPAAGLLLARPYLLTQASFQLSFLAVTSLVYPGGLFSSYGKKGFQGKNGSGKRAAAVSAFFTSLSVQMVTAPVILWHSFGLPLYGVFLNLIVIPLMTYVVVSGFLGLFLGFFSENVGGAMLGGAHYILKFYEAVCENTGKLPGAELVLGQPKVWQIGGFYLLLILGAVLFDNWNRVAERLGDLLLEKRKGAGEKFCRFPGKKEGNNERKIYDSENETVQSVERMRNSRRWNGGFFTEDGCKTGKEDMEEKAEKKGEEKKKEKNRLEKKGKKREKTKEEELGKAEERQKKKAKKLRSAKWKNSAFPALCLTWLLACVFLLPIRPSGLSVTFLDVGQGDGIVLRTSSGTILMDCGSSQIRSLGEKVLVPYLKSQGITKVDLAVMTHGDQDHINGIRYLLEHPESGIRLGGLMMPEAGKDEIYEKMAELAAKQGIPVFYAGTGDCLDEILGKNITLQCLSPDVGETFADRNEESLVFRLTTGRFSMLLTGDLEKEGEERLIENGSLSHVTVLKAGHHGSATSTGEEFLKELSPDLAILSYGRENRYGHPAPEVKERLKSYGIKIYETGVSGAVMIHTDGKRMKISVMLQ